jgi:hypothetical protein
MFTRWLENRLFSESAGMTIYLKRDDRGTTTIWIASVQPLPDDPQEAEKLSKTIPFGMGMNAAEAIGGLILNHPSALNTGKTLNCTK